MNLLQAIVLGVVQGITEFLPISSTAHLILFPWLLGWQDPGQTFDVALHAGTVAAVLYYFRSDWMEILTRRRGLILPIVLGCVPAGIAGIALEDRIERMALPGEFRFAPLIIAGSLLVVGIWLYRMDHRVKGGREMEEVSLPDALAIGVGQALALLPGVSRSGATIGAGLMRGLSRETAARFSFLLSTPITAAAVGLKAARIAKDGIPAGSELPMVVGILASGISGYLAIRFLMNWVKTRHYDGFVVYRIGLAVAIAAIWLARHGT